MTISHLALEIVFSKHLASSLAINRNLANNARAKKTRRKIWMPASRKEATNSSAHTQILQSEKKTSEKWRTLKLEYSFALIFNNAGQDKTCRKKEAFTGTVNMREGGRWTWPDWPRERERASWSLSETFSRAWKKVMGVVDFWCFFFKFGELIIWSNLSIWSNLLKLINLVNFFKFC